MHRRFRLIFPVHTSPRRIAYGTAIGLFVAFLPAVGFQMGLALVIAWVLNVSRPAAMACVWVTNPLTMGPVFAFTYLVGRPFWFHTSELDLLHLSQAISGAHQPLGWLSVFDTFRVMFGMGAGVLMPMLIGGVIVGGLVGCFAYQPTKLIVTHVQKSRRRRGRSRPTRPLVMGDGRFESVTGQDRDLVRVRKAA